MAHPQSGTADCDFVSYWLPYWTQMLHIGIMQSRHVFMIFQMDTGRITHSSHTPLLRPFSNHVRMRGLYEKLDELLPDSHHADTLVIYVYSKSDTEYQRNLEFFVRNGMWEGDGCDYIIIVQQVRLPCACMAHVFLYLGYLHMHLLHRHWIRSDNLTEKFILLQDTALFGSASLPQLPRNARYLFHENKCYDWGTFGWVFEETKVNTNLYKSIIFMNSSVRGPFLPPYFPVRTRIFLPCIPVNQHPCCATPRFGSAHRVNDSVPQQVGLHWSKLLTLRLSSTVKLVGSSISCEPAWEGGNTANEKRQNAHVQSYVMATDQVDLEDLSHEPVPQKSKARPLSAEH